MQADYKYDNVAQTYIPNPCRYLGISYNSVNSLSTTHNSFVGYEFVEEKTLSETGIPLGKTEYSFTDWFDGFLIDIYNYGAFTITGYNI